MIWPTLVKCDWSMRAIPKSATLARPSGRDQNIFRFDVAMDYTLTVGAIEGLGDLLDQLESWP